MRSSARRMTVREMDEAAEWAASKPPTLVKTTRSEWFDLPQFETAARNVA